MPDQERKALAFLRVYHLPDLSGEGRNSKPNRSPDGATVKSLVKISHRTAATFVQFVSSSNSHFSRASKSRHNIAEAVRNSVTLFL